MKKMKWSFSSSNILTIRPLIGCSNTMQCSIRRNWISQEVPSGPFIIRMTFFKRYKMNQSILQMEAWAWHQTSLRQRSLLLSSSHQASQKPNHGHNRLIILWVKQRFLHPPHIQDQERAQGTPTSRLRSLLLILRNKSIMLLINWEVETGPNNSRPVTP